VPEKKLLRESTHISCSYYLDISILNCSQKKLRAEEEE
jgi:hypothetical protein